MSKKKTFASMTKEEIIKWFESPCLTVYDGLNEDQAIKIKDLIHSDTFIKLLKFKLGWMEVDIYD